MLFEILVAGCDQILLSLTISISCIIFFISFSCEDQTALSNSQMLECSEGPNLFNTLLGAASCCLWPSSHRQLLWNTLLHRLQTRCIVLMN